MKMFNYLYGLFMARQFTNFVDVNVTVVLLVTSVHCPTNLAGTLQSEYEKYDFIKAHY
jgi:hypothetical protein